MMVMNYSGVGPGHLHAFTTYMDVWYSIVSLKKFSNIFESNS